MTLIEKLKESKRQKTTKVLENIALKITDYQNEFFCGVRIDTGEEAKVFLKDFNSSSASAYSRPSIDNFKTSGGSSYTEIGGVILFDNCELVDDGIYSANWANVLSSKKGKAYVVSGMTRLSTGVNSHGKDWMKVDFVKSKDYLWVSNQDELDSFLLSGLKPATQHSNPFVMIKVTDEDGNATMAYANVSKYKDKERYQVTMSAADSLSEFKKSETYGIVLDALLSGEYVYKVEVLHAVSMFAGPATLKKHFDREKERVRLESHYIMRGEDEDGNARDYFGYTDSTIAMRPHGDGTLFITHVKPKMSNGAGVETKDIKFFGDTLNTSK